MKEDNPLQRLHTDWRIILKQIVKICVVKAWI
jgi:hypothetical protein